MPPYIMILSTVSNFWRPPVPPKKRCGPNGRTIRNNMITPYSYTAQTNVSQRKLLLYGLHTRQHSVVPKGCRGLCATLRPHNHNITLYTKSYIRWQHPATSGTKGNSGSNPYIQCCGVVIWSTFNMLGKGYYMILNKYFIIFIWLMF